MTRTYSLTAIVLTAAAAPMLWAQQGFPPAPQAEQPEIAQQAPQVPQQAQVPGQPPQVPGQQPAGAPVLAANQLDDLVAPIALYPDPLLTQILVASTYPLELVQASQWLARNPGISGPSVTQAAQQQNWDPSVQALVLFPDLIKRLTDDIAWTTNLGNAVLGQESDVMAAVQRMRQRAQQSGALTTTPQQTVTATNTGGSQVIQIMPADPQVIYVPTYSPAAIYGPSAYYPYPYWNYPIYAGGSYFNFGYGISIGAYFGRGWGGWGGWGWQPGWGAGTIIVNNNFFRRYNYYGPGYGVGAGFVNWSHAGFHRQGVPYANPVVAAQFGGYARQTVVGRPVAAGQSVYRGGQVGAQVLSRPSSAVMARPSAGAAPVNRGASPGVVRSGGAGMARSSGGAHASGGHAGGGHR